MRSCRSAVPAPARRQGRVSTPTRDPQLATCATDRAAGHPRRGERQVQGPAIPRKEERVLARFWLTPTPRFGRTAPAARRAHFLESDRRDLPETDERNGDQAEVSAAARVGLVVASRVVLVAPPQPLEYRRRGKHRLPGHAWSSRARAVAAFLSDGVATQSGYEIAGFVPERQRCRLAAGFRFDRIACKESASSCGRTCAVPRKTGPTVGALRRPSSDESWASLFQGRRVSSWAEPAWCGCGVALLGREAVAVGWPWATTSRGFEAEAGGSSVVGRLWE